ncbi:MAG: aldo/keto reductase [Clostridia bacterium]|nr:aldo/keto reductase [Clostridia bacterium]
MKNKLGFGAMRLKMVENKVDYDEFNKMIDMYIEAGFNYFDTAHGYLDGLSEIALRNCLVARYDREDYVFADKISAWLFEKEEEVLPLFEKQLEICGLDYFDFYLFHCMNTKTYPKYKECNVLETVRNLKEQGRIKHIGMSFHDKPEYLDLILTENPWIEFVQLQINYLDYDDPAIQSKKCYDVAVKHGKKIVVMEPVKGGYLANLPEKAAKIFESVTTGSHASYALRYAASLPNVYMVLSGMGTVEMMQDNINTFTNFVPFNDKEFEATDEARKVIREVRQLPCTKCNYCADVCPEKIPISDIFSAYNSVLAAKKTKIEASGDLPENAKSAAQCIKCGECENVCPQHISIRENIEKTVKMFRLNK